MTILAVTNKSDHFVHDKIFDELERNLLEVRRAQGRNAGPRERKQIAAAAQLARDILPARQADLDANAIEYYGGAARTLGAMLRVIDAEHSLAFLIAQDVALNATPAAGRA